MIIARFANGGDKLSGIPKEDRFRPHRERTRDVPRTLRTGQRPKPSCVKKETTASLETVVSHFLKLPCCSHVRCELRQHNTLTGHGSPPISRAGFPHRSGVLPASDKGLAHAGDRRYRLPLTGTCPSGGKVRSIYRQAPMFCLWLIEECLPTSID